MPRLFVLRRTGPGPAADFLLARDATPRDGWAVRDAPTVRWVPAASDQPYCAWYRRSPREGHAVTTGGVPAAAGDWSLDFVFYVRDFDALPVAAVERPKLEGEIALVKPLLLDVLDVLNRHDFPYWADSGTMLGAMRHRGIIPWDKDCDLGILRRHKQDLLRLLRSDAPGFGMRYMEHPTMWLTSEKYGIRVSDVFTYTFRRRFQAKFWSDHAARFGVDVEAGYLVYDQPLFRTYQDQRFNLPWSLFHPTRLAPFYDRQIKVPRCARTLLRGMYGDDCFTRMSTNHMNSDGATITSFLPL